ncbi:glycosyltransferase family 4 protein [Pedobacter sp. JY14-1]|uniref:glycosyltransferase family 4 protein n=1 Tax=Pedobacter sp. JY14-1 TaxID=3034151 RepID=UPI0023E284B7|nr:glycosyltransferase family 4 protein [Pedobacter sp. JY14-1]
MKILFLTHFFNPSIGGIEVNSEILAGNFAAAGHEVRLLTWTREAANRSFPYEIVRNPGLTDLVRGHAWADVVFENNPCLRLAWPAFLLHKKRVVALRSWIRRDDGTIGWQDKLKLAGLTRAGKVIAVSGVLARACWPDASVIGNPYRAALFRTIPGTERTSRFVFLGRLVPDKGADMAIRALKALMDKGVFDDQPGPMLSIIGEGPEMTSLRDLARQLDMKDHVQFPGTLTGTALVHALNNHGYLLVPSRLIEPFGNVAIEGMACGCIPVVADEGGLPEAVGNAGLSFKRNDLDDLVGVLTDLIGDVSRQSKLRGNALRHLEKHRPEVVSRRYLDIIEAVAGKEGI